MVQNICGRCLSHRFQFYIICTLIKRIWELIERKLSTNCLQMHTLFVWCLLSVSHCFTIVTTKIHLLWCNRARSVMSMYHLSYAIRMANNHFHCAKTIVTITQSRNNKFQISFSRTVYQMTLICSYFYHNFYVLRNSRFLHTNQLKEVLFMNNIWYIPLCVMKKINLPKFYDC